MHEMTYHGEVGLDPKNLVPSIIWINPSCWTLPAWLLLFFDFWYFCH